MAQHEHDRKGARNPEPERLLREQRIEGGDGDRDDEGRVMPSATQPNTRARKLPDRATSL